MVGWWEEGGRFCMNKIIMYHYVKVQYITLNIMFYASIKILNYGPCTISYQMHTPTCIFWHVLRRLYCLCICVILNGLQSSVIGVKWAGAEFGVFMFKSHNMIDRSEWDNNFQEWVKIGHALTLNCHRYLFFFCSFFAMLWKCNSFTIRK